MNQQFPFNIFSCNLLVEGNQRSSICDLQRGAVHLIPNSLYEILTKHEGKTIEDIKSIYKDSIDIIDEYFEFLLNEELIFFSDSTSKFPKLNLVWESPSYVTNCIIDFNKSDYSYLKKTVESLDNLLCQYLEIRFFHNVNCELIDKIISFFEKSTIISINIICPYSECLKINAIKELLKENKRITGITICNSPNDEVYYSCYQDAITFTKNVIINELSCGKINQEYFVAYVELFTESLHHNTCLNRKIAIDVDGNIKNCPSMKESFGNIKDTTLEEAINKPGFKKYWNITKDQITKCKDCEFRHVCTDCRAYLENPEDIYSAPLKCGYDPYTCKWEEWSANPLKQKAIDYYGLRPLMKNEK